MNDIKITNDGFVWLIVTHAAEKLWASSALPIYELFEDGTEALITGQLHFQHALESGNDIGVEIAFLQQLNESHQQSITNQ